MELLDLTTQSFGAWHVLGRGVTTREMAFWVCRCQCGTIAALHEAALLEGRAQSCGCLNDHQGGFCDLTGQRFGQWLVVEYAGSTRNDPCWQCECRCKAVRVVTRSNLQGGHSQQCKSCAKREPMPQRWYGALFVQGFAGVDHRQQALYHCQCRCGVEVVVKGTELRRGHSTSCGCRGKRIILHQTFGGLYIVADAGIVRKHQHWQCVCLHCGGMLLVASKDLSPKRLGCRACAYQRRRGAYLYRAYADIQRWFLEGISVAEIARRCQAHPDTVRDYIRRHLAHPLDAVATALEASGEELVVAQEHSS